MAQALLLDTNALIFYLYKDALSPEANELVQNTEDVYVSIASLWEIAIKQSIGKLEIKQSITDIVSECTALGITLLQIEPKNLDYMKILPKIHGDPFDRLIISQAATEGLLLITKDETIPQYCECVPDLQVMW